MERVLARERGADSSMVLARGDEVSRTTSMVKVPPLVGPLAFQRGRRNRQGSSTRATQARAGHATARHRRSRGIEPSRRRTTDDVPATISSSRP